MNHSLAIRVYYEDTDLAGIVYYANYLKFIERARTEFLRALGFDQARLRVEQGLVFAVQRIEADYLSPARFDDKVTVETCVRQVTGARTVLQQEIRRDWKLLFSASVTLVCLSEAGRPVRLPTDLRACFQVASSSSA